MQDEKDNLEKNKIQDNTPIYKSKYHKIIVVGLSLGLFFLILGGLIYVNKASSPQNTVVPSSITFKSNQPSVTRSKGVARIEEGVSYPLKLPLGYAIGWFAKNLGNGARDLEFSPGGVLLVSLPSSGKVVALPDYDKNGVADDAMEILTNLDGPHGIAFFGNKLFIAEEMQVVRYAWDERDLKATFEKKLFDLPGGAGHNTRSVIFDKQGRMFVSIGSSCNVCYEREAFRSSVIVSNSEGENPRIFSKGLRNAVFMALNPNDRDVWVSEMGRDNLGDNIPPDEINILKDNENFGWPVCYGQNIHDTNFDPSTSSGQVCANKIPPVYEIPAHSAPLGLTFINSKQFSESWQGDLLVAYHGSWNRSVPDGYKVVRLDIEGNKVIQSEDFITGFIQGRQVSGRPVDMVFDTEGSLYLSDDKANGVYKIIKP